MKLKTLDVVVLCFLILVMLITRIPYLNWGLPNNIHPYSYHPDEAKQLDSIANMHPSQLDFNPDEFIYPSLQYYINAFALESFSLIGYVHLIPDITFYIKNPTELAKLFLVGRLVTLLFSIGTILLVYLIGKRLYNEKVGMLAAVILTIIPAYAIEAHYMTVDVPLTFWITLTLLFSTYVLKEDKWWPYLLAGLSSGLATATKYPGVFAWFFVLGAHILKRYRWESVTDGTHDLAEPRIDLFDKKLVISGVLVVLGFFLGCPYCFIDYTHSIPAIVGQWSLGQTTLFDNLGGNGIQYHKFTYLLFAAFPYMLGIPLYLLLIVTLFMQPNKKHFALLMFFIIPFFLLFAISRFAMVRYYLPLLPMFSLMISAPIMSAPFDRLKLIKYFKIIFIIMMIATSSVLIGQNRKFGTDTRDEAYFWIKENIPLNSTLLVSEWAPLRYTPFRDPAAMSGREVNDSEIFKVRDLNSPENVEGYKVLTLFNASDTATLREPDYIIITSLDWSEYYRNQSTDLDYKKGLQFYEQIRGGQDWKLIKSFDRTYFGESIYVTLDPRFKSSYASPRIEIYGRINHSQVKA